MRKILRLPICIILLPLIFVITADAAKVTDKNINKFVHVSSNKIIDEQNKEFTIKGISFGNNVWSLPEIPSKTHHTEISYKEISELGFNSVRFYLNYNLFENDKQPYKYKQSGFDWLDKNIKWAKKYGIKLILNMHIPQGGFQSLGNGMELWTEINNQKRLNALWKEIAKRYHDEPVIIGYGLINEPIVPLNDTIENSVEIYRSYIKNLINIVRTVDKNHIIFVENLLAVKNLKTNENIYTSQDIYNHFIIDDNNIVYEFHDYTPFFFTHQDKDWAGTSGIIKYYPSNEITYYDSKNLWIGCQPADKTSKENNGWVFYESKPIKKTKDYNLGRITCQSLNAGSSSITYFDEITVTEYDSKGQPTEIIKVDSNYKSEFGYWSDNNSGIFGSSDTVGYNNKESLYIKGATGNSNFTGKTFELRDNCSYVISAWVKQVNCNYNAETMPRIDFVNGTNLQYMDKDYLENNLLKQIEFATENNVPVYLGEFGVVREAFTENRGALQWVKDMIELCGKYDIHFNYHTYHELSFGLYMNPDNELPNELNKELANLFKDIL